MQSGVSNARLHLTPRYCSVQVAQQRVTGKTPFPSNLQVYLRDGRLWVALTNACYCSHLSFDDKFIYFIETSNWPMDPLLYFIHPLYGRLVIWVLMIVLIRHCWCVLVQSRSWSLSTVLEKPKAVGVRQNRRDWWIQTRSRRGAWEKGMTVPDEK